MTRRALIGLLFVAGPAASELFVDFPHGATKPMRWRLDGVYRFGRPLLQGGIVEMVTLNGLVQAEDIDYSVVREGLNIVGFRALWEWPDQSSIIARWSEPPVLRVR